ncbi:flavoprotein [Alteribacillus sp. HJP-4]|uniref:flavoprotein n=1 Tax=Alteribacillus sp. HJP-4 TaxID=2775394 RepID=UPI0035CCF4F8
MKKNAHILVGITGSISVLNLPAYLGFLKYHYTDVNVIMTEAAARLLPPSTVALFCDDVYEKTDFSVKMGHVEIAKWADIFLVLPATANKLAEAANGLALDFLSSTMLAHPHPIMFFPNMNQLMWNKASVQRNIDLLKKDGHIVISPIKKEAFEVASGTLKTNYLIPDIQHIAEKVNEELLARETIKSN